MKNMDIQFNYFCLLPIVIPDRQLKHLHCLHLCVFQTQTIFGIFQFKDDEHSTIVNRVRSQQPLKN